MDYISREAALKAAGRAYGEWNLAMAAADGARQINLVYKRQELLKAVAAVFDIVPAADVEPVRRWIPCSERMPNPGERVLATDGSFVGEMYIGKRGEWRRYNVTYIEDLIALDILWWMPLPEPPKEGGTENAAD